MTDKALLGGGWERAAVGITWQPNRERLDAREFEALLGEGERKGWSSVRDAMFRGDAINGSEGRAVGHCALRADSESKFLVDGVDQMPAVVAERERQAAFTDLVRGGANREDGGRWQAVVHIGIGGSDLGPRMFCEAIPGDGPKLYFVGNVDAHALHRVLANIDPATTLVLLASKTFTTRETLLNADIARSWLGERWKTQMIALTANPQMAQDWGILPEQVFEFWSWVGGRYSLWGAVGLPMRLHAGNAVFDQFLAGARALDQHFLNAAPRDNLPALAAHLDFWNRCERSIPSRMVAAYDSRLAILVPYLQQLSMESLGKGVDQSGSPLETASAPLLWGDVGTNAQHAFFQQLHQGDQTVACELLGVVAADHADRVSHRALHANLLSQAEVLCRGWRATRDGEVWPAGNCRGAHPVSLVWLDRLDAWHLGALIAFWEQRTLVFGCLLGVNPYDQWGVERGKQIARNLEPALAGNSPNEGTPEETLSALAFLKARYPN